MTNAIAGLQIQNPTTASSHFSGSAGAVSFAALLAAARPVGPELDLETAVRPSAGASLTSDYSSVQLAGIASGVLPARAGEWLPAVQQAARSQDVDPDLLTALVWTESAFRVDAISPAGAIGLGQLMPGTAAGLGVDPHDPRENLRGSATYLAQQLRTFGSVELALAAYNAGPGRVHQSGGVPNIAETQAYVRIVSDRYNTIRQERGLES